MIAFTDIFLSVITFTFSGLWLTGQVNDSSIGTHLETIWFKLVELDIIAVSVFVVVLVEFDKYYRKQIQISDEQACLAFSFQLLKKRKL